MYALKLLGVVGDRKTGPTKPRTRLQEIRERYRTQGMEQAG
jgi:hypothetical protein